MGKREVGSEVVQTLSILVFGALLFYIGQKIHEAIITPKVGECFIFNDGDVIAKVYRIDEDVHYNYLDLKDGSFTINRQRSVLDFTKRYTKTGCQGYDPYFEFNKKLLEMRNEQKKKE